MMASTSRDPDDSGGSPKSNQSSTQSTCLQLSSPHYLFLTKYEDLVNSTRTSVLLEEEHDARRQMASIVRAASQQVLASFENLSLSASSRNTTSNAEATMKEKKLIGTNNCQMSKKHALSSGKATFNYRMS
ncbi:hypothetical protein ZIOFF_021952 [Zingiber officinale]|uniref:Uncharacterized protein n=1 Tax=Zingiber officinale TaxID=94328 RepID=A0A8J5LGV5_ZINOF|nr:hypothetical protein ZIOFF_021952 [Zingiber officinale]